MEAFLLSLILGFTIASIGAWKDTEWEPFSFRTYFRSPLLAGLWAIPIINLFQDNPPILIALSAISMERLTVESWKGLLRKKPSKFKNEDRDTQWIIKKVKRR